MRATLAMITVLLAACADDDSGGIGSRFQTVPDASATYRLVIEFGSSGSEATCEEILDHASANGIASPYVHMVTQEGDLNLCFTLNGLDVQAQADFVTQVDALARAGSGTTVHENARCDVR